jgi:hypothetical protein
MHWRLLTDWHVGVTSSVISLLDAQVAALEETFDNRVHDPDDFLDDTEHVLGLGLVALQQYLRATRETIRIVLASHSLDAPSMTVLLRSFGDVVAGTGDLRELHAVWHLANFWKHRDEWDDDWTAEAARNRLSAVSIQGLAGLGIENRMEYPCVRGVERLSGSARLEPLLDRAIIWREACLAAYPEPTNP